VLLYRQVFWLKRHRSAAPSRFPSGLRQNSSITAAGPRGNQTHFPVRAYCSAPASCRYLYKYTIFFFITSLYYCSRYFNKNLYCTCRSTNEMVKNAGTVLLRHKMWSKFQLQSSMRLHNWVYHTVISTKSHFANENQDFTCKMDQLVCADGQKCRYSPTSA
jgi:hypothetical protein